ncbi:MAG TPA: hypothetical protein VFM54_23275 [Micromonosporaceae bacterium]|nr:hypothetical protein [Micromonosporaceae bacterium]
MQTRFNMGCTRCGNACPLIVNAKLDGVLHAETADARRRPA